MHTSIITSTSITPTTTSIIINSRLSTMTFI
jgi:hypothetical protein